MNTFIELTTRYGTSVLVSVDEIAAVYDAKSDGANIYLKHPDHTVNVADSYEETKAAIIKETAEAGTTAQLLAAASLERRRSK